LVEDPVDQYLMATRQLLLRAIAESACWIRESYVLASQLSCAAYELPLSEEDEAIFGSRAPAIASILEEEGSFKSLDGLRYWSSAEYPARQREPPHDLRRHVHDPRSDALRNAVLGTVDSISAPELVYPEAIYLHEATTYFVRELDLKQKVAYVERARWTTTRSPCSTRHLKLEETRESKKLGDETVGLGPAAVSWQTVAMKKIRFRKPRRDRLSPAGSPTAEAGHRGALDPAERGTPIR